MRPCLVGRGIALCAHTQLKCFLWFDPNSRDLISITGLYLIFHPYFNHFFSRDKTSDGVESDNKFTPNFSKPAGLNTWLDAHASMHTTNTFYWSICQGLHKHRVPMRYSRPERDERVPHFGIGPFFLGYNLHETALTDKLCDISPSVGQPPSPFNLLRLLVFWLSCRPCSQYLSTWVQGFDNVDARVPRQTGSEAKLYLIL